MFAGPLWHLGTLPKFASQPLGRHRREVATVVEDDMDFVRLLGYQKTAIDCLTRGVTFGSNTKLDTLSPDQRRRHDAVLLRVARRATLVRRKLPLG